MSITPYNTPAIPPSDLELLELGLLGAAAGAAVAPEVGPALHLLQPLGEALEPLADLSQPGQGGAQVGSRLLQPPLEGPPVPLGRVQGPVLDLGGPPGDDLVPAGQHGGEERLALGTALLQELGGGRRRGHA